MKNAVLAVCFFGIAQSVHAYAISAGQSPSVRVDTSSVHEIFNTESIRVSPEWCENATEGVVTLDGAHFASVTNDSEILWQPQSLGAHTMTCTIGTEVLTASFNVTGLAFDVVPEPNPPMPIVPGLTITPLTRNFGVGGGGGAVLVQGSGTWTAVASEPWIVPTATRSGTLTVAGNEYTVFQYGRRMKLGTYLATRNYETHPIPITVNALAITTWSVTPNNSWISVLDAGNGRGGDEVTVVIGENPSYKARTGTVTIGTETFTVVQEGRTELEFEVSPAKSTASVNGANALIAVTATPDLPWTAKSEANWVSVYDSTTQGAGNGNIVYSASPNSTIYERTGTVVVTPEPESGLLPQRHTVVQPAPVVTLTIPGYTFEASGETVGVGVTVASVVSWEVENSIPWLTVVGSKSHVGPATVTLQASENTTIYPRSGTLTIAGKTFSVTQLARGVEVEYESVLFDTDGQRKDGGTSSISVHPDGNSSWTAVASDPSWIIIYAGASGTGDGEVQYIIAPYVGSGTARVGTIQIGDKTVYVTQRAYDLSIEPNGETVKGNAGAGAVPKASSKFAYLVPFEITDTSVIYTYAVKNGLTSPTNVVTLTKGQVLTFADAASAEGIETFTLGGDADWTATEDANAKVGNASVRSGEIGDLQTSWFEATVEGAGTLTFWWKASCEEDELQEFDHLVFSVDGVEKGRLDGLTGWVQKSVTLSAGTHTLHWAYEKDESDAENDDCGWVDGIVWTPSVAPAVKPSIEGDSGATVTGDATNGFVVKPSSGKTAVEVTIPTGVAADKVTVEVSTNVATIKPHGAKVKIVKGGNDITEFLDIPAADASGAVNLALAAVKETIVKEALDVGKGAVIKLDATNPQLTTSPMRMGLTYTLCEGTTLQNMHNGVSTVGNGEPWTPAVSVKGGDSGFYTIKVTK